MINGALKAPLFSGRSKNEIGLIAVEGRLNQLGFTTIRKPRNGLPPFLFVEFKDGSRRKVHYKYSAEYDNFRMPNINDISANDLLGLFLESEDCVKIIEGLEVINKWKPVGDDGNLFFHELDESPCVCPLD
ncbi:MAG: hypothetical protein ACR2NF_06215 [Pirellulales bacterium]